MERKHYDVYMELLGAPLETVTFRVLGEDKEAAEKRARIMANKGFGMRDPLIRKTTEVE